MTDHIKDTQRAMNAAKCIIDGRDLERDYSKILVTAEHAFATILIACMGGDARKAAAMLNEGLVPHIEERLALHTSKTGSFPK